MNATLVVTSEPSRLEKLKQTISASRLGLWNACRLKFFFRYVLQIKKSPTPSLHAGSTAHSVLQHWNMSRWRREEFKLEFFKTFFGEQWKDQGTKINWGEDEEADKTSTWQALEHYFLETPIKQNERPEAVEVAVEADLSHHGLPSLIGILDLVRAGGRIVDFKLVGKSPDQEKAAHLYEAQLTAYSVLYRDATSKKESGLELHHLVRTKVPKLIVTSMPPATDKQHTRLFKQIESYQQGIDREDFVPSPSFACGGCEFFNECRKWS
jgi:CRISPR/Cas system-associated exonuclease Cas4 (RecB family)